MASRRKKRKNEVIDPLGGFTLEQLLGIEPVLVTEKRQGMLSRLVSLPFRLVAALVAAPFRLIGAIIKLPFRIIKALLPPYGSRKRGKSRQ